MQIVPTHVILVDYIETRLDHLGDAIQGPGVVVHRCRNRIDAMGKYWLLYAEGILPRAVVASWLMDTPDSRAFFKAVGREVDHTSLALFANVAKLDPDGMLICFSQDVGETLTELENSGIHDKVQVISTSEVMVDLKSLIHLDERSRLSRSSSTTQNSSGVRRALLSR